MLFCLILFFFYNCLCTMTQCMWFSCPDSGHHKECPSVSVVDKLDGLLFPKYAQSYLLSDAFPLLANVIPHSFPDHLDSSLHERRDHLKLGGITFS